MASVEIAKWWRKRQRTASSGQIGPDNGSQEVHVSGRTKLRRLLSQDAVRAFLENRFDYYGEKLRSSRYGEASAEAEKEETIEDLLKFASFAELLKKELPDSFQEACEKYLCNPKVDEDDRCVLAETLRRQERLRQIRIAQKKGLKVLASQPKQMPEIQVVPIVSESELSYEKFILDYAMPGKAVVIRGGAHMVTEKLWTFEDLSRRLGDRSITVKRFVADSAEWANLEGEKTLPFSEYVKFHTHESESGFQQKMHQWYLHDWSIPQHYEDLLQDLSIPKYFAGDYLQRLPEETLFRESWPSLFVGPQGTFSNTHVDSFGSNFWMALMSGRKKWTFFDRRELPYLYPRWIEGGDDPVFEVDLRCPDFNKHPLLRLAAQKQVVIEEGDLLFVPGGTPHFVENLEDTIALSGNYIDASNFTLARDELYSLSLQNTRAKSLLLSLKRLGQESRSGVPPLCRDQKTLSWKEFKTASMRMETYAWDIAYETTPISEQTSPQ